MEIWNDYCFIVFDSNLRKVDMRTSEDAPQLGLYASECCLEELIYCEGDTFWRCPRCHGLCEWELLETVVSPERLERWQETKMSVTSTRFSIPSRVA